MVCIARCTPFFLPKMAGVLTALKRLARPSASVRPYLKFNMNIQYTIQYSLTILFLYLNQTGGRGGFSQTHTPAEWHTVSGDYCVRSRGHKGIM